MANSTTQIIQLDHKAMRVLDRIAGGIEHHNALFVEAYTADHENYHDSETMTKVYTALKQGLNETLYHTQDELLTSLVSYMQNAGILFRERKKD